MPSLKTISFFECPYCDFETSSKSSLKLLIKLHNKKCKKTGRTKIPQLSADRKRQAAASNPNCSIADHEDANGRKEKRSKKMAEKSHHVATTCDAWSFYMANTTRGDAIRLPKNRAPDPLAVAAAESLGHASSVRGLQPDQKEIEQHLKTLTRVARIAKKKVGPIDMPDDEEMILRQEGTLTAKEIKMIADGRMKVHTSVDLDEDKMVRKERVMLE